MIEPGLESLAPPVVAIILAIATRTVVVPLLVGVATGAVLVAYRGDGDGLSAAKIFYDAASASVLGRDHVMALVFSLTLGGMVGVLERCGGMVAVIKRVSGRLHRAGAQGNPGDDPVDGRSRAQRLIAATGLVIFFDDYANTLLVGGTMRTTADRFGISREKLAYLVDSTSAPIAGLSVISTWAAIEMSYMSDGLRSAGFESDSAAFELFWRSIPYRFYPILALVMVGVVVWTGRDFGPMRQAEKKYWDTTSDRPVLGGDGASSPRRLHWAAIVPIVVCLASVLGALFWTGSNGERQTTVSTSILGVMEILGNGDPYLALVIGGGVGLITAAVLHRMLGEVGWDSVVSGALAGAWQMMPAMIILWLAWALTDMTDQLRTGEYLAAWLSSGLPAAALPSVVFLVAGGVAFSTGTSWGTMGLLTPLSVRLSIEMLADSSAASAAMIVHEPLVLATSGAVLAGAIFGDHCSPISDTTVLSSRSSGCDHLAHVRTQLPYALLVALVSIVVGAIPASFGCSPWICLAAGVVLIVTTTRVFGRRITE